MSSGRPEGWSGTGSSPLAGLADTRVVGSEEWDPPTLPRLLANRMPSAERGGSSGGVVRRR